MKQTLLNSGRDFYKDITLLQKERENEKKRIQEKGNLWEEKGE